MGSGPLKNGKRLKEDSPSFPQSFILGTHGAGGEETWRSREQKGSKRLSYKGQGLTRARMAGQSRVMSPLQNRGAGRVHDKHPVSQANPRCPAGNAVHFMELARQEVVTMVSGSDGVAVGL